MAVKYVTFDYQEIVKESEKAWNVHFGGGVFSWCAKSACILDSNNRRIKVPKWLEDQTQIQGRLDQIDLTARTKRDAASNKLKETKKKRALIKEETTKYKRSIEL